MLNEGLVIHSTNTVKAALVLVGGVYRYCSLEQVSVGGGCFDKVKGRYEPHGGVSYKTS